MNNWYQQNLPSLTRGQGLPVTDSARGQLTPGSTQYTPPSLFAPTEEDRAQQSLYGSGRNVQPQRNDVAGSRAGSRTQQAAQYTFDNQGNAHDAAGSRAAGSGRHQAPQPQVWDQNGQAHDQVGSRAASSRAGSRGQGLPATSSTYTQASTRGQGLPVTDSVPGRREEEDPRRQLPGSRAMPGRR